MNQFEKNFDSLNLTSCKLLHYFDIYEKHFSRFKKRCPTILEVGIDKGGSLELWGRYFGWNCNIYGVDSDGECEEISLPNTKILIGNQFDVDFWEDVKGKIPKIDIFIDDGSHVMEHQIVTYESIFDHISDDGIYLCEDTHTSYYNSHNGGYKKDGNFIEYTKNIVDYINAWHWGVPDGSNVNNPIEHWVKDNNSDSEHLSLTKRVNSIHYYDSVVVLEFKKNNNPPSWLHHIGVIK